MMGIHQDIQDKVIEELDQIFGDSDRPVTFQDTLEMKYLERCLMETLRLYPPVPIIARQVNQEITLREYKKHNHAYRQQNIKNLCKIILNCFIKKKKHFAASNGKKIPAGTTLVIATYKLHRRPDVYPNPNKFDPDNFLPERSANRHYYAFVPFSAGPRSCVGE